METNEAVQVSDTEKMSKGSLRIQMGEGDAWVALTSDGAVTFGPAYLPGSEGHAFWTAMAASNPLRDALKDAEREAFEAREYAMQMAFRAMAAEAHLAKLRPYFGSLTPEKGEPNPSHWQPARDAFAEMDRKSGWRT